jgi:hypothetical protein
MRKIESDIAFAAAAATTATVDDDVMKSGIIMK